MLILALSTNEGAAVAVALVGFVGSVVGIWDFYSNRRRRREVTWKEVDHGVIDLVHQVERDKFGPDLVVAVGRGGAIIAAMLATNLSGVRVPIAYLDTDIVEDGHGRKEVKLRNEQALPDVTDRNVLVVVAELWSGLDLEAAYDFISQRGARRVRTLSLLVGAASIMRPDFCAIHTKNHPRAPWRINDASTKLRG